MNSIDLLLIALKRARWWDVNRHILTHRHGITADAGKHLRLHTLG
jgi:hypothetical protein